MNSVNDECDHIITFFKDRLLEKHPRDNYYFFNLSIKIFEKVKYLQIIIYEMNCSKFSFLSFVS